MLIAHPVMTFIYALSCIITGLTWIAISVAIVPRVGLTRIARYAGVVGIFGTGFTEILIAGFTLFDARRAVGDLGGSWLLLSASLTATVTLCLYAGALFAKAPSDQQLVFVAPDDLDQTPIEPIRPAEGSAPEHPDGTPR